MFFYSLFITSLLDKPSQKDLYGVANIRDEAFLEIVEKRFNLKELQETIKNMLESFLIE